ncbi:hypothetical protein RMATCC62417_18052 [Rhizopus microsporus]|nr:hypothetical protein RMATCC62417_18052 [Rhizopus microsporus]
MTVTISLKIEKTTDLLVKFETPRKALACSQCTRQGVFRHNSSTKAKPEQAIFHNNDYQNAATKANCPFLSAYPKMPPIEKIIEISRHNQETSTRPLNLSTEDVQNLLNMIQHLNSELVAARSKIEHTRAITV